MCISTPPSRGKKKSQHMANGASVGNLLIGYLRDKTGSYDLDMFVLWGMAIITFVLSVLLVFQDKKHGSVLSAPSARRRTLSVGDDEPMQPVLLRDPSDDGAEGSPERRKQQQPQSRPATSFQSADNVV